ncbi:hypothetical protein [Agrococcus jejuensis]|uniref:Uncharacterized protein n=1 Tax=Agrococcus jejuensis TaxID=399736 RepID=A0A1G8EG00_9MICO|nr:hypothetical protein [Agrococcus jejuensis]SDH68766.1 hypothetical protein SAMN04489720_2022 [Agrococcus jejuensis]
MAAESAAPLGAPVPGSTLPPAPRILPSAPAVPLGPATASIIIRGYD